MLLSVLLRYDHYLMEDQRIALSSTSQSAGQQETMNAISCHQLESCEEEDVTQSFHRKEQVGTEAVQIACLQGTPGMAQTEGNQSKV